MSSPVGRQRAALLSALNSQREHILGILDGLSEEELRRPVLPSGWTCLGLVQHLARDVVGTPIEPRNVNRRGDELRQRAGLEGLWLHDLRHGCATFLLDQGVPARAIMEMLEHTEIGVRMNTYAHILPVLDQEAADAIDELFGA